MNLLELTAANKSFSSEEPGLQLVWDSTSLGLLKDCPWKYYLTMIEGWHDKHSAVPLQFGIAYHEALESYSRVLATCGDIQEATRFAVRTALRWSHTLSTSEDTKRTVKTLVRAVVWYIEEYRHDTVQTKILAGGNPAVELTFRFAVDERFLLAGHLDRVVYFNDQPWILDYKTTAGQADSRYFSRYSPDNQISMYSLAAKVVFGFPVAGVVVDACELAVGFNRYVRGTASRTAAQLDEWLDDTMFWLEQAEMYARRQHWPMNDKHCFLCTFKDICSKDPSVRQTFIQSGFERRIWDPSVPR